MAAVVFTLPTRVCPSKAGVWFGATFEAVSTGAPVPPVTGGSVAPLVSLLFLQEQATNNTASSIKQTDAADTLFTDVYFFMNDLINWLVI
jgi:hypothetical protein